MPITSNIPDDNPNIKIRIKAVIAKLEKLKPLLEINATSEKEMFHSWLTLGEGRAYQEIVEEFSSELGFLLKEQDIENTYDVSLFFMRRGGSSLLCELLEADTALLEFLYDELCVDVSNLEIVQSVYIDFKNKNFNFLKNKKTISEFPSEEKVDASPQQQMILNSANAANNKNLTIETPPNRFLTSTSKVYLQIKTAQPFKTTVDEYTDKAKILLKNNIYSMRPNEILDVNTPLPSLLEDIADLLVEGEDASIMKCRIM